MKAKAMVTQEPACAGEILGGGGLFVLQIKLNGIFR
jgi:hypothetical protein